MPEPFKQDELQVRIAKLEKDIESNLGKEFFDKLIAYGFKEAILEARKLDLDNINDTLQKSVAFNRLMRLKREYAILEVADYMDNLRKMGCIDPDLSKYINISRIDELVVFG
jgi:hypothetical protein